MITAGKRRFPAAGFTLVEILVAMTLFSLVLAGLYSALYTSGRGWSSAEAAMRDNDAQRLGMEFIRRSIEQAVPLLLVDERERRVIFRGEADSLEFVSRFPAQAGGTGLYRLRLSAQRRENRGAVLLLEYEPAMSADFSRAEFGEEAREVELMDGLDGLRFEYFGRRRPDETPGTHKDWREGELLPQMVSMHTMVRGGGAAWPALAAPIRATSGLKHSEFLSYPSGDAP